MEHPEFTLLSKPSHLDVEWWRPRNWLPCKDEAEMLLLEGFVAFCVIILFASVAWLWTRCLFRRLEREAHYVGHSPAHCTGSSLFPVPLPAAPSYFDESDTSSSPSMDNTRKTKDSDEATAQRSGHAQETKDSDEATALRSGHASALRSAQALCFLSFAKHPVLQKKLDGFVRQKMATSIESKHIQRVYPLDSIYLCDNVEVGRDRPTQWPGHLLIVCFLQPPVGRWKRSDSIRHGPIVFQCVQMQSMPIRNGDLLCATVTFVFPAHVDALAREIAEDYFGTRIQSRPFIPLMRVTAGHGSTVVERAMQCGQTLWSVICEHIYLANELHWVSIDPRVPRLHAMTLGTA